MKYDLNSKKNRFAQRTLADFSETMFALLQRKAFEDITVHEICAACNYPRATFYNYFEDIYDLLNYCWHCLAKEIRMEDCMDMQPQKRLYTLFDRFYDFMDSQKKRVDAIMRYNSLDGGMLTSFRKYLKKQISSVMEIRSGENSFPVSYELLADHYSNTILLVVEWCFLRHGCGTRQEADRCLRYLLHGFEGEEAVG